MSPAKHQVFLLGPGYVGREIIDRLLAHGQYEITTIVRREAAGKDLESDGVHAVKGDLNDEDLISRLAEQSDIVFHTATADHLESAKAILAGINKRAREGKHTIYLHQSGAAVLSDDSKGNSKNDKIYSDLTADDIDALPDSAPHRSIDLAIVKARKDLGSMASIFIMMPPIIYGTNPKYNRLSIQVPTLTRFAIKHNYSGQVGGGKSIWQGVHVLDLADAYMVILDWIQHSGSKIRDAHPYFFCENGELSWNEVAAGIGKALHDAGRISDPNPRTIPESDYVDVFGDFTNVVAGSNCRNHADRLRTLGWAPKRPDFKQSLLEQDLPVLLQEKGDKAGYAGVVAS